MSDLFFDKETEEYEERRRQRNARREEHLRQQREREKKLRRYMIIAGAAAGATILIVIAVIVFIAVGKHKRATAADKTAEIVSKVEKLAEESGGEDPREELYEEGEEVDINQDGSSPAMTELSEEEIEKIKEEEAAALTTGEGVPELNTTVDADTRSVAAGVDSGYAILISISDNKVVEEKNSHTKMYPASMTKVMTVLVAAEHLKGEQHLDDIFTMTKAIEGFSYENGCSNVGFSPGERIRVEDLFYGTILPSGADAAMGLAEYTAGDQESFVAMMNEKLDELGLSETSHFTNCVGLYNDEHYTTAADMAVIMNAAINNPLCLQILSQHTYTTTATSYHPQGILVSNWFLRRIEDKQATGVVLCGKTGYVKESLNCAVSYGKSDDGNGYICCTGYAHGGWTAIHDHVKIYTGEFDPELYQKTLAGEDVVEETGDIEGEN